jgi:hypothetical protein
METPSDWAQRTAAEIRYMRKSKIEESKEEPDPLLENAEKLWSATKEQCKQKCEALNAALGETLLEFQPIADTYLRIRDKNSSLFLEGSFSYSRVAFTIGAQTFRFREDREASRLYISDERGLEISPEEIAEFAISSFAIRQQR